MCYVVEPQIYTLKKTVLLVYILSALTVVFTVQIVSCILFLL